MILKYKEPAIRWIHEVDPYDDDPGVLAADVNAERTVYLISDGAADTPETLQRWLKKNYKQLFEAELKGWYTEPSLWPKRLTLKLFKEWSEVECHTVLLDRVGDMIYDDEL